MLKNSLETLGKTSFSKFTRIREATARIQQLEATLGIPASKPIWNLVIANVRVAALERQMAAAGKAVDFGLDSQSPALDKMAPAIAENLPIPQPTAISAPSISPASVTTTAQFLALSASARETFSQDRGALSVDAFNALPLAARVAHFEAGGRIVATSTDKTRRVKTTAGESSPANSRMMTLTAFSSLGVKSQVALLRLGLQIAVS